MFNISVDCVQVSNFWQITIRFILFSVKFSIKNISFEFSSYCILCLLKIYSVNDAVQMTANHFQQNISIKLADDYLSTCCEISYWLAELYSNLSRVAALISLFCESILLCMAIVLLMLGCDHYFHIALPEWLGWTVVFYISWPCCSDVFEWVMCW